jgi:adenylate cyclase
MSQHRQLSAIMFTDIEGYSAMMQQDEQRAMGMKDQHRKILQDKHQQFNGRVIQYYGDGTLSIFQSAVEAVACASSMQQAFCLPPEVPVRIGIHIGDIIFDEDNIFGDGVNLASRIESLGVAGSVLLSDKVNDEINNQPEFKTYSVGTYQFKNIKRKVEVFALDHEGLVKPDRGSLKGKTEDKKPPQPKGSGGQRLQNGHGQPSKSIAVLPFINMSNDPEQEYFSAGVAEEILNSLSNLPDLKVAGPSSSFQFSTKDTDLRDIGEKLGVSTVLEGSVRKQGNRLRVTVQLVNVEDGFQLWSEKFERNFDDIFAIQDEIAVGVTEKLKLTLLETDRKRIVTRTHTQNAEAYELYLKGRFYINKRGVAIITGIHCFQLAIDMDPGFALAYSGYADANLMAAFYGLMPAAQVISKAKKAAETALAIDPSLCEPYCSLGCYYTCFEWNWEEAEKNFQLSIERNPKYAQAHYWFGNLYLAWAKGDFFRAETHARIAIELEPFSSICYGMYGAVLHTAGKFEDAVAACKKGVELDPDSFNCRLFLGWSQLSLHRYEEAVSTFEQLFKATSGFHLSQNALIVAYCIVWKFQQARVLMKDLRERSGKEYIPSGVCGLSAAYLENLDEAFEYFEKAFKDREPVLLSFKYEHWVPDTLREDPRFQKLLDRIGFP